MVPPVSYARHLADGACPASSTSAPLARHLADGACPASSTSAPLPTVSWLSSCGAMGRWYSCHMASRKMHAKPTTNGENSLPRASKQERARGRLSKRGEDEPYRWLRSIACGDKKSHHSQPVEDGLAGPVLQHALSAPASSEAPPPTCPDPSTSPSAAARYRSPPSAAVASLLAAPPAAPPSGRAAMCVPDRARRREMRAL